MEKLINQKIENILKEIMPQINKIFDELTTKISIQREVNLDL
jgi:hypothetical protein